MQASHFKIHVTARDYTILTRGRLLCLIAHTELGPSAWQSSTPVVESIAAASAGRVQSLFLLEEFPLLAPPEARAQAEVYARTVGQYLSKSAVVIEGGGLRTAFVRSVITGMAVLSRSPYPRRIFGNITDALYWLNEGTTPREIEPAAFLNSLEQVRREVDRHVA